MKDVSNLTGASNYKGRKAISEVTFNGNSGVFYYRDKDAEKGEDGKYPKQQLTTVPNEGDAFTPLSIVVMKIRRKLSKFAKGGKGKSTNEHNVKTDFVVLYGENKDRGTAEEIRGRHPELRTQQMLYAFLPSKKETVRVVVKGASLGSEFKHPKEVKKFYDYLQTFKGADHVHEYFTNLIPVKEQGPNGEYFALSFSRGAKLSDEQQEKINTLIEELHAEIEAQDASFKAKFASGANENDIQMYADEEEEEEAKAPEGGLTDKDFDYPEENINPEDIPF